MKDATNKAIQALIEELNGARTVFGMYAVAGMGPDGWEVALGVSMTRVSDAFEAVLDLLDTEPRPDAEPKQQDAP